MRIAVVHVSSLFDKHYKKLPNRTKLIAQRKEKIFRDNPFDRGLKTHKLHGQEHGVYAFWIDYRYRIKFVFISDTEVLFLDVGTHEIYK